MEGRSCESSGTSASAASSRVRHAATVTALRPHATSAYSHDKPFAAELLLNQRISGREFKGVGFRQSARIHQAFLTELVPSGDSPNSGAAFVQVSFEEFNRFDHHQFHVRPSEDGINALRHERMHNGFQFAQGAGVLENNFPEP